MPTAHLSAINLPTFSGKLKSGGGGGAHQTLQSKCVKARNFVKNMFQIIKHFHVHLQ